MLSKVLEAAKLAYANESKEYDSTETCLAGLNVPEVFSSSDKAKVFAKNFSKNSNLYNSGITLPVFSPTCDMKLHNIAETPKMNKKVITNLDSSGGSG